MNTTRKHKPKYHIITTNEGKRRRWNLRCTRCGFEIKYNSDYICEGTNEEGASHHTKCAAKRNLEEKGIFDYTEKDIVDEIEQSWPIMKQQKETEWIT